MLLPATQHREGSTLLDLPVIPWAPIVASVDSVETAAPLRGSLLEHMSLTSLDAAPHGPVDLVHGLVNSRGVAPPDIATKKVIVPCVFNKPRFGVRKLTSHEIAKLWDVPILFLDHLKSSSPSHRKLLRSLCTGHPCKVLVLGCDVLFSSFIRGGVEDLSSSDVQQPLSQRPPPRDLDPFGEGENNDDIYPNIREDLEAIAVSVKQDGQKSDDAPVHTGMWDGMFLRSRAAAGLTLPIDHYWVNPRADVHVPAALDPRDGDFSDNKVSIPITLPRWRWALTKIRAAVLRYWRKRVGTSFLEHLNHQLRDNVRVSNKEVSSWVKGKNEEASLDGGAKSTARSVYTWNLATGGREKYREWWSRRQKRLDELPEVARTFATGVDVVSRAANALWWDWHAGSTLMFWRWPRSHLEWARDGQPHFTTGELPNFREPQRREKDKMMRERMKVKVNKVRKRKYINIGYVVSITMMFAVAKGLHDIRMVYNGTSSGLNDALWAPHFGLPLLDHTLRSLLPGYLQADLDVAEMFLCFNLHPDMRPYAGVDVTHVQNHTKDCEDWERERRRAWECWWRNFMGMKDSPYRSIQLMLVAKFLAYGDRLDPNNPFQWERIVLNLPGSESYDPSLPWVMKIRKDGKLGCEIYIYVDDGRVTGWCKLECWRAVQKFSRTLSTLGIQDASRKRTPPSTVPGPWAGGVTATEYGKSESNPRGDVVKTVTQLKWEKIQALVGELREMFTQDARKMNRKRLEEIRGFLIYVARTFKFMNPYLKGLHLTIDGWREDRDEEGYRVRSNVAQIQQAEKDMENGIDVDLAVFRPDDDQSEVEAPETVVAVPRMEHDIETLEEFTEGESPAVEKVRVRVALLALYLMGDASGDGFGSSWWDGVRLEYEAGNWKREYGDQSSNFREAYNLVAKAEEMGRRGLLIDREIFIFTDNSTFEGTYYKGHSKTSPLLTELVRRLRMVERKYGAIIHVIHIAGTRMKAAGIDGLSRGDLLEGIMKGSNPWSAIPINEDANFRTEGRVETWIRSWWSDRNEVPWLKSTRSRGALWESEMIRALTPTDWFNLFHIKEHRLWMPPPAAMETVIELFNEDRLVNPHLTHIFAIPRLMTHLWRKQLFKDADLRFYVRPGAPFWPRSMHEPLTIVVVFPIAYVPNYRGPWTVKQRAETAAFGKRLDSEFGDPGETGRDEFLDMGSPMPSLWEKEHRWTRDLLFQFLYEQRSFPPVQGGILRSLLPSLRGRSVSHPKVIGGRRQRKRLRGRGGRGRSVHEREGGRPSDESTF